MNAVGTEDGAAFWIATFAGFVTKLPWVSSYFGVEWSSTDINAVACDDGSNSLDGCVGETDGWVSASDGVAGASGTRARSAAARAAVSSSYARSNGGNWVACVAGVTSCWSIKLACNGVNFLTASGVYPKRVINSSFRLAVMTKAILAFVGEDDKSFGVGGTGESLVVLDEEDDDDAMGVAVSDTVGFRAFHFSRTYPGKP